MSSKSLVICDQEEGYTAAVASFLMRKKELAFQVQVCRGIPQVMDILRENPIDILLIGGNYPIEERREVRAGNIFVLAESGSIESNPEETVIYKYQSGEAILSEVICRCSEKDEARDLFFHSVKNRKVRVIGIFSPVHRSGKTSYGLKLGQELASSAKVLYLNLEIYGGIGGYFPREGHSLEDLLYYSRQENKNLGLILTTLVGHMGTLDYLLPARVSEDIKSISLKEWTGMILQVAEQSIYDVLILDIDEGLKDVYGLLRICTEVCVPVMEDAAAGAKLCQMEEEMHLLGYDDVKKKMKKKELIM